MGTFTLKFKTDGAAFHSYEDDAPTNRSEVATVLREAASAVLFNEDFGTISGAVSDHNGNTVGSWTLTESARRPAKKRATKANRRKTSPRPKPRKSARSRY